jgi:hypothetical protein
MAVDAAHVLRVAYFHPTCREVLVQRLRLRLRKLQLEQARFAMEDRHPIAGLVQVRGEFAADQAAANHRPARGPPFRAAPRVPAPQGEKVVEAVQREDVRQRRHERRRDARRRAGREHQHLVVELVDRLDAAPHLDPNAGQRTERLHHDLRRRFVGERHAVREARPRVVAVHLAGDQRHVVPRGGGLRESDAGESRADYDDTHSAAVKSVLVAPQSGQHQSSGSSSQRVPGAMPEAGSPAASS